MIRLLGGVPIADPSRNRGPPAGDGSRAGPPKGR